MAGKQLLLSVIYNAGIFVVALMAYVTYNPGRIIKTSLACVLSFDVAPHMKNMPVCRRDAYRPYVAGTLNNLAGLYAATERYTDAEITVKDSLGIYIELSEQYPRAYLPEVVKGKNNLGQLYNLMYRPEDSQKAYAEAEEYQLRLDKLNEEGGQ